MFQAPQITCAPGLPQGASHGCFPCRGQAVTDKRSQIVPPLQQPRVLEALEQRVERLLRVYQGVEAPQQEPQVLAL